MTLASLFALLTACGNPDEPTPACHDVFYADQDGDAFGDPASSVEACEAPDGYTAVADDCDDTRYSTRPGADERCNGADDDCDGSIDEGAIDPSIWFLDTDGDGYGDEAHTTEECAQPPGYAPAAGDCNETDSAINPGADEICDGGVDNDCDHLPDEDDPGLTGATQTWYVDGDYDTFGDPLAPISACDQPLGGVPDNTDCNDDAATAHPGANEICDGIDNDCDELVDQDDDELTGLERFWPDGDGDGFGSGASVIECFAPSGYVDNNEDCDDGDSAVGEPTVYYRDWDGDGFGDDYLALSCSVVAGGVTVGDDCDDWRADVFPGAVEVCDGVDDNCDDLIDDADPAVVYLTFYGDDDGDGYGEDTDTVATCTAPSGYVAASGDCDDTEAFVFPDAYELCDEMDNDCNGSTDDAIDYVDWYADVDADGYGDATDSINDCAQPSGYVLGSEDCDDGSSSAHPGVVEDCSNGLDDNCDGGVDNCPIDLGDADLIVQGLDEDGMLGASLAVGDVDADGTSDLVLGAPAYGYSGGGTVFVLLGPATGSRDADDALEVSAETDLGADVAAADIDVDGADDLVLAAPSVGSVYLLFGPISASRDVGDAEVVLVGPSSDRTGTFVETAFDFDGDGSRDVLVGSPYGGGANEGVVYVISGASSGTIDLATDATYTYVGAATYDQFGYAGVDLGDATGDGFADIALSSVDGPGDGVVYLQEGGLAPGSYAVDDDPLARLRGDASSNFGFSLGSADYDNDGAVDVFVGAPTAVNGSGDIAGAVFGFLGPLEGLLDPTDAAVRWDSTIPNTGLGRAIAVDGDLDGDKTPDVLMGASTPLGAAAIGCAYLQLGLASGSIDVASLDSFPAPSLDYTGYAVRFVRDWDGDDGSEVIIGSPLADTAPDRDVGAVHVFFSGGLLP